MITDTPTPQMAAEIASHNITVKIPNFDGLTARLMGYCDVDAGMVYLGDPCYFIGKKEKKNPANMDWHDFLNEYIFTDKFRSEIPHAMGHKGMGVCVDTYYGDGSYPVIGFFKPNEIRPLFVTIDFNGEFLSEYDEDESAVDADFCTPTAPSIDQNYDLKSELMEMKMEVATSVKEFANDSSWDRLKLLLEKFANDCYDAGRNDAIVNNLLS